MKRFAMDNLIKWKNKKGHKPLIINGARQVGKTYLMKKFAEQNYKDYVYVNFEKDKNIASFFDSNISPKHIMSLLEMEFHKKIDQDTLIIFDEIQECSRALTSLKYFNEDASEYDVISSGSTMGITLHHGTSFPVGKVDFLKLYPMCFEEFLYALGEDRKAEFLINDEMDFVKAIKDIFIDYLKLYYFVGGMPKVVKDYVENKDLNQVRENQNTILQYYKFDFGKYADPHQVSKLNLIFDNIPSQLSKQNSKFIYSALKKGARASDYEFALEWLIDSHLIYKVYRVSVPHFPLRAYIDLAAFKIYFLDVGLLSCMSGLTSDVINKGSDIFVEYKGTLAEQYVFQELKNFYDYFGYYYANNTSTNEIDFLYQTKGGIVPIEVKAGINLKSKSLKAYMDKYNPPYAMRISLNDYKEDKNIVNIPLYNVRNMIDKYV